ncbi:MAG: FHA domain-containing protein [Deltaproteobacteria bacterium]|nr:FHA domain-containing protein [Deltaproteobacteria bacterium]
MLSGNSFIILGRAADCDVVIAETTVSSRHARLSWDGDKIFVEDLASANGTWIGEDRVHRAAVRPGDRVMLGHAELPWAHPKMKSFVRLRGSGTLVVEGPKTVAGNMARSAGRIAMVFVMGFGLVFLGIWLTEPGRNFLQYLRLQHEVSTARTDEEAFVRSTLAPQVRRALDPAEPVLRNTAVQIASRSEGTFRVEQVAALWTHVRSRWRYVNDPRGREYVAMPKESIQNNYAGDCDDFAVTLAGMVRAIGGEARVVFMEGARGGHAYAEACVQEPPATVATKIARYYGRNWARYAGSRQHVAFRSSSACAVWLNLDWNGNVPGGDYEPERWAVAAYGDGHTEVLAVAPGAVPSERARRADVATAPRRLSTAPAAPSRGR